MYSKLPIFLKTLLIPIVMLVFLFLACNKNPIQDKGVDTISFIKETFQKTGWSDKLIDPFNDSLSLVWLPNWDQYAEKKSAEGITFYYVPLSSTLRNKNNSNQRDHINQIRFQQYLIVTSDKSNNYTFQRLTYIPRYRIRNRSTGQDMTYNYAGFTGYSITEDFNGHQKLSYFKSGNLYFDGGKKVNSLNQPLVESKPNFDTVDLWKLNPDPGTFPENPRIGEECSIRCVWSSTCGIGAWNVATTIAPPKAACTEPQDAPCDNGLSPTWKLNYSEKFNCSLPVKDPVIYPLPPGDGGTGSGTTGGARGTATVNEITNQLKSPCLISGLHMAINSDLKDRLQDMICSMFSRDDKLKMEFKEEALLDKDKKPDYITDGDTRVYGSGDFKTLEVVLNTNALKDATLEYIVATIYHESIHAYLYAINFNRDLSQHNEMGFIFIDRMSLAIKASFPEISSTDGNALAWGGVHESYSWIDILKNSPQAAKNIISINDIYKTGKKGKRCN